MDEKINLELALKAVEGGVSLCTAEAKALVKEIARLGAENAALRDQWHGGPLGKWLRDQKRGADSADGERK